MQFRFDPNQEYQVEAIEAVAGLLEGQPRIEIDLQIMSEGSFAAVPNRLDLDESTLLANLQSVQTQNGIAPDPALACIEETIQNGNGDSLVRFPNFSIEMETGTGKTYVYIRTALELFRRYGYRKFIVVVPSVAIREGVLKTLQVTERHLRELYGNLPYRYYVYDSATLSQLRQFTLSDSVELMIMTIDSFNKAMKENGKGNVIHRPTDRLQGETPIHLVQATRPILILDEPQNMESEKSIAALAALQPLFALRYSATHRNPYNVIYRLTPFEAYRQGLVKQIEVASVLKEDDVNQVYVWLKEISSQKNTVTARLAVHKLMKDGTVKEQELIVRPGDSLREKTERPEYDGFDVDEINPGEGFIRFTNDVELSIGEQQGADKEAVFDAQIRYTIEEHFRKQKRLKDAGIKVLSLFFIDHVDNYIHDDGIIRKLFVQAFNDLKKKYPEWADVDPLAVQSAYFAEKRRKGGVVEVLDSISGKTKEDEGAYDLIMKDKERLLSTDEPVSFIFSHSALREGWDNPNVFQICTLNQTASEMKKRQEVGRGVRLAVDQSGERIHDERLNVLTVVANESYERFVENLQSEVAFEYRAEIEARYGKSISKLSDEERRLIEEEYGEGILPPKPANARRRVQVKLRKEYTLKPEFQELWNRIKQKTRYSVQVDSEKLIDDVVRALEEIEVKKPRIAIAKARVEVDGKDSFQWLQISAAKTVKDLAGRYPLPNLIEIMSNLMAHTSPPMKLTRRTLLEIYRRTANRKTAIENPHEFAQEAVRIIKERIAEQLVAGIQYEKINDYYEMTQLEEEFQGWEEYLVQSDHGSVYDHVKCDSDVERAFVEGLEKSDEVKLYIKLPAWFTVPTPVGEYNPDWAIVLEKRDEHGAVIGEPMLYLVRETKDKDWRTSLREDERRKIHCGRKHFQDAIGVDYEVVSSASELMQKLG